MAIEVEVELVLQEHRQVIVHDPHVVMVVLPEHGVVLHGGPPHDRRVLVPLSQRLKDPIILLIAFFPFSGGADGKDQVVIGAFLVVIVRAADQARVHEEDSKLLAVADVELLFVVEVGHLPVLIVVHQLQLLLPVELAVMVAPHGEQVQILEVLRLENLQHHLELLILGRKVVLRIQVVSSQNQEVQKVLWVRLVGGHTHHPVQHPEGVPRVLHVVCGRPEVG
eukprot:CAMPEP_0170546698 /NCGR_PEP_ID=MMETSP0211-20121228/5042_1 /TAXON_ID=311385 /ORGANISM="Pseudokeronopsis sp., Strain OXSARD2" /LENGTH=222 /DNA_ID=CAMNT_0010851289 /DNA_START=397 /DNA_END=1061 /DNA_ORIENTATION=-